ncbi:MAG TPA: aromatic amino acid transaminase, partial [Sphingomicrobium sp.]|nr:aromatic amino acid transaminase [Sphingomicrobium sp.]
PIPASLKAAEKRLWEQQETKSYLGGYGDVRFTAAIRPIALGRHADDARIAGVQTPGGCGALALAFRLIGAARPDARVLIGTPTWPNHQPMVAGAGLEIATYPFYDRDAHRVRFEEMLVALKAGQPGDIALLHGCCHNPTGADLDAAQWDEVAAVIAERNLLPVVDLAYQGLGRGFEQDAAGLHKVLDASDEALVAYSCDKNFGVYRDRVGALFVKTGDEAATKHAMAHVLQIARELWSMPPDHGAAAARIVLEDAGLRAQWFDEVGMMRDRINSIRARIAAADPRLAFVGEQFGMFSMLPLSPEQVAGLRAKSIYMADSGRFNVVGMADHQVDDFIAAVIEAMNG